MTIAIDFDGTCVSHEFPKIGHDIGAASVLRELVANGHQLILFTMRSDRPAGGDTGDKSIKDVTGNFLTDAVQWFERNFIPLYGIQYNPTQRNWTQSNKCYAELYIDDAALGCPLIYPEKGKPFADWRRIRQMLLLQGIIKPVLNEKKV